MGVILKELQRLKKSQIYFDANIFIYALEGIEPFCKELEDVFESVDKGNLSALTSELSLAECLVKPIIVKDLKAQEMFDKTLTDSDTFKVIPVSRQILKDAAHLRASFKGMRLPDAIHLATAQSAPDIAFLTNDSRLRVVSNFQFLILKDLVPH